MIFVHKIYVVNHFYLQNFGIKFRFCLQKQKQNKKSTRDFDCKVVNDEAIRMKLPIFIDIVHTNI